MARHELPRWNEDRIGDSGLLHRILEALGDGVIANCMVFQYVLDYSSLILPVHARHLGKVLVPPVLAGISFGKRSSWSRGCPLAAGAGLIAWLASP